MLRGSHNYIHCLYLKYAQRYSHAYKHCFSGNHFIIIFIFLVYVSHEPVNREWLFLGWKVYDLVTGRFDSVTGRFMIGCC